MKPTAGRLPKETCKPLDTCDEETEDCDSKDDNTASMPDPSWPDDQCWATPGDDLRLATSLLPWIQPDPTAPVEGLDDCLRRFFGARTSCPPSTILCLDPPEVGECDCKQSPAPGVFRGTSACQLIDCRSHGTCDPATGACVGGEGTGLGFFPGGPSTPEIQLPEELLECLPPGLGDLDSVAESVRSCGG